MQQSCAPHAQRFKAARLPLPGSRTHAFADRTPPVRGRAASRRAANLLKLNSGQQCAAAPAYASHSPEFTPNLLLALEISS